MGQDAGHPFFAWVIATSSRDTDCDAKGEEFHGRPNGLPGSPPCLLLTDLQNAFVKKGEKWSRGSESG
jgi:hypothetical protein